MARISFAIGTDSRIRIMDDPSDEWPERRHAWITLTGAGSGTHTDDLTLHIGSFGCPTDAEIIGSATILIEALETLRRTALARTYAQPEIADTPLGLEDDIAGAVA